VQLTTVFLGKMITGHMDPVNRSHIITD